MTFFFGCKWGERGRERERESTFSSFDFDFNISAASIRTWSLDESTSRHIANILHLLKCFVSCRLVV